jgi:hypothetical protein
VLCQWRHCTSDVFFSGKIVQKMCCFILMAPHIMHDRNVTGREE